MHSIEQQLRNKNIRPTAMRILIFKYMEERNTAVSLANIEKAFEKAERTTLYRSIRTFEENGLVHQIDNGTNISKYALCEEGCNCELNQDLHLHFHCQNCDETVCLTEQKLPHINLPEGYTAQDANLVIKGICEKCNTH